jgi:chromosome segregation ATPase
MRCYLCDFEILLPPNTHAIVACPSCKRNIITDGSDSEEITRLNQLTRNQTEEINIRDRKITEIETQLNLKTKDFEQAQKNIGELWEELEEYKWQIKEKHHRKVYWEEDEYKKNITAYDLQAKPYEKIQELKRYITKLENDRYDLIEKLSKFELLKPFF